jgi:hypothetical protein
MTTTRNSMTEAPVPDPRLVDGRDENAVDLTERSLIANTALNYGTHNFCYGVEADEPTWLPKRLWYDRNSDTVRLERRGVLKIVDVDRAVVPEVYDVADGNDLLRWRGVAYSPDHAARLDHWRQVVIDRTLAWAILHVAEAWEAPHASALEHRIAEHLVHVHDQSFLQGKGSSQPWLAEAERLVLLGPKGSGVDVGV